MYQEELRKPVHVVFCLDYSGSMYGEGKEELEEAMEFVLGEEALTNLIQFSSKDKINIVIFNYSAYVLAEYSGSDGELILNRIKSISADGGTSLYPAVKKAIELLEDETDEYNVSIILMTDGEGNIGTYEEVNKAYKRLDREIPIYSITFASASEDQLNELAELSNGKVFDGKTDLVRAFKTVRGYN